MSFRARLSAVAPPVLLAIIVLTLAAFQLFDLELWPCQEARGSPENALHAADNSTCSLREFLNSNPAGSVVVLAVNGRPSRVTWNELYGGMVRVGAQREVSPIRGASFVLIGAMDARLGSAVSRLGVQEVEIELEKGQEVGSTGIVAPCRIVAKSIGDAEGIGRAIISVGGVWCSPNKPGVNVVVIDGSGHCINRGHFR